VSKHQTTVCCLLTWPRQATKQCEVPRTFDVAVQHGQQSVPALLGLWPNGIDRRGLISMRSGGPPHVIALAHCGALGGDADLSRLRRVALIEGGATTSVAR
jgi:hypothetical protein